MYRYIEDCLDPSGRIKEDHPNPSPMTVTDEGDGESLEVSAYIAPDGKTALFCAKEQDDDGDIVVQDVSAGHARDLSVFFSELGERMDEKAEAHHQAQQPKPVLASDLEDGEEFVFTAETGGRKKWPSDTVFTKVSAAPAGTPAFLAPDGWIYFFRPDDEAYHKAHAEWLDECI